ncbi:MAG: fibrinogen-like YCDxxxxGGGW domain-containing protein [Myxococcota bacterium]|nr:fibrinogen-like YCDxxxxGGGW domain-containing protein [Myxococcota bacterium]
MKYAPLLLAPVLMIGCVPQSVSAPSLALNCESAICRANQVCVEGECVDESQVNLGTDGGSTTGDAGGSSTGDSDAGPQTSIDAGGGTITPRPGGDGTQRDRAARSCQDLLAAYPGTESDDFWIDPDGEDGPAEPVQTYCGMEHDVGGWTRVARVMYGDEVWDAWNDRVGRAFNGNQSWGLPLKWFSDSEDGEDLEIIVGAVETAQGEYYIGPIFGDVNRRAWQPGVSVGEEIDDGFYFREEDEENERCEADLWRRNARWSWAISRGENGCSGWSGGGGFVLYGSDQEPENAYSLWGLYAFGSGNRGSRFGAVDLWVRRR